jgi:hypothetical protein
MSFDARKIAIHFKEWSAEGLQADMGSLKRFRIHRHMAFV